MLIEQDSIPTNRWFLYRCNGASDGCERSVCVCVCVCVGGQVYLLHVCTSLPVNETRMKRTGNKGKYVKGGMKLKVLRTLGHLNVLVTHHKTQNMQTPRGEARPQRDSNPETSSHEATVLTTAPPC